MTLLRGLSRTLRLWQKSVCTGVLTGHEGSVLSLLILPEDHILSGSIDKTMRLWKNDECISVFSGHSDTVRCTSSHTFIFILSHTFVRSILRKSHSFLTLFSHFIFILSHIFVRSILPKSHSFLTLLYLSFLSLLSHLYCINLTLFSLFFVEV